MRYEIGYVLGGEWYVLANASTYQLAVIRMNQLLTFPIYMFLNIVIKEIAK